MGLYDGLTIASYALGAVLLVAAVVLGRKRGLASAVRFAAAGLLFAGLAASGLTRVVARTVNAVASFATNLVFNPLVWAGFGALALSLVLFVVSGRIGDKKVDAGGGRRERKSAKAASTKPAVERSRQQPAAADDDMDDIEAILRRHGIE